MSLKFEETREFLNSFLNEDEIDVANEEFIKTLRMKNILLIGSNYVTDAIYAQLVGNNRINLVLCDRRDPHHMFNINPDSRNIHQRHGAHIVYDDIFSLKKDNFKIVRSKGAKPEDTDVYGYSILCNNFVHDPLLFYENLKQLDSIDVIINTAFIMDRVYGENNIGEMINYNVLGTTNILNSVYKRISDPEYTGNRKPLVIHVSNSLVYGKQDKEKMPFKEDQTVPNPIGPVAGSLLAQETMVKSLCQAWDIPYLVLRVGTLAGYYTPLNSFSNQLMMAALDGNDVKINGDGHQSRDFVSTVDFSLLIPRIVRISNDQMSLEKIANQTYNIGSMEGNEIQIGRLAYSIIEGMGKFYYTARKIPKSNINITGRHKSPVDKNIDSVRIWMNTDKSKEVFSYYPIQYISYVFLKDTVKYICENYWSLDEREAKEIYKALALDMRLFITEEAEKQQENISPEVQDLQKHVEAEVDKALK